MQYEINDDSGNRWIANCGQNLKVLSSFTFQKETLKLFGKLEEFTYLNNMILTCLSLW